jgi:hypothetical protein
MAITAIATTTTAIIMLFLSAGAIAIALSLSKMLPGSEFFGSYCTAVSSVLPCDKLGHAKFIYDKGFGIRMFGAPLAHWRIGALARAPHAPHCEITRSELCGPAAMPPTLPTTAHARTTLSSAKLMPGVETGKSEKGQLGRPLLPPCPTAPSLDSGCHHLTRGQFCLRAISARPL